MPPQQKSSSVAENERMVAAGRKWPRAVWEAEQMVCRMGWWMSMMVMMKMTMTKEGGRRVDNLKDELS